MMCTIPSVAAIEKKSRPDMPEVELLRLKLDRALAIQEHDQGVILDLLDHRGKLKIALLKITNAKPEEVQSIISEVLSSTTSKEFDEHGGVLDFSDVNPCLNT